MKERKQETRTSKPNMSNPPTHTPNQETSSTTQVQTPQRPSINNKTTASTSNDIQSNKRLQNKHNHQQQHTTTNRTTTSSPAHTTRTRTTNTTIGMNVTTPTLRIPLRPRLPHTPTRTTIHHNSTITNRYTTPNRHSTPYRHSTPNIYMRTPTTNHIRPTTVPNNITLHIRLQMWDFLLRQMHNQHK